MHQVYKFYLISYYFLDLSLYFLGTKKNFFAHFWPWITRGMPFDWEWAICEVKVHLVGICGGVWPFLAQIKGFLCHLGLRYGHPWTWLTCSMYWEAWYSFLRLLKCIMIAKMLKKPGEKKWKFTISQFVPNFYAKTGSDYGFYTLAGSTRTLQSKKNLNIVWSRWLASPISEGCFTTRFSHILRD